MPKLYEGYLTENKLAGVLGILFPKGEWIRNKKIPQTKSRIRPDFRNEHYKLIVEYDGHLHYSIAKSAVNDIIRADLYEELNYDFFNLPYFIQIDHEIYNRILSHHGANHIRNIKFTDFPQGFISNKCKLPADFCTAGLMRFAIEIYGKYLPQFEDIMSSLENKSEKLGNVLVNPIKCYCEFLPDNI